MNIWLIYLNIWYWLYLLLVPIVILSIRKEASPRIESTSLLFSVIILPIFALPLDHARTQTLENVPIQIHTCWIYNFYFFCLLLCISIVYVGWWECARRFRDKKIFLDFKKNLKCGLVSNTIIAISVLISLWLILTLAGCKFCGLAVLWPAITAQEIVYKNIIPLVC